MTDPEGRLPGERAPSRDPDAAAPMPDVDEDARDRRPEGFDEGVDPFLDMSNQNPEIAPRAAGPWPAGEEAPPGTDRSTEGALDEPGLQPRGATGAGDEAEGT